MKSLGFLLNLGNIYINVVHNCCIKAEFLHQLVKVVEHTDYTVYFFFSKRTIIAHYSDNMLHVTAIMPCTFLRLHKCRKLQQAAVGLEAQV